MLKGHSLVPASPRKQTIKNPHMKDTLLVLGIKEHSSLGSQNKQDSMQTDPVKIIPIAL